MLMIRLIFITLLTFTALLEAQTDLQRVLNQPLDITPRCQKGDNQEYEIKAHYLFIGENNLPISVKENTIKYQQLCLNNSQSSGLDYQITIDLLEIGKKHGLQQSTTSKVDVEDFQGFSFNCNYLRSIPNKNDCWDPAIPFSPEQKHTGTFEFIEVYKQIKLLEQFRYSLGKRLSYIGDSVSINLPGPICFEIPEVINRYKSEQTKYHIKMTGISKYLGQPCAIITLYSDPAPLELEIYSSVHGGFPISGATIYQGVMYVSLIDGDIVKAELTIRSDGLMQIPEQPPTESHVITKLELTQKLL